MATRRGPHTVATISEGGLNNTRKLTKDSAGYFYVVFSDEFDTGVENIYMAKSTDGGETWVRTAVTADATYPQRNPSIAIDSNDYVHIVWDGRHAASPSNHQIRYRKWTGSWQTIENLTTVAAYTQFAPSIAVNSSDDLHVVWTGYDAVSPSSLQPFYRRNTGSWEATKNLDYVVDRSSQDVKIVVGYDDALYAVWLVNVSPVGFPEQQYAQVVYKKGTSAGVWDLDYTQVSTTTLANSYYCDMVVEVDADLHFVYVSNYNNTESLLYRKRVLGTAWAAVVDLSTPAAYGQWTPDHSYPSLALETADLHLVYDLSWKTKGVQYNHYATSWWPASGGQNITTGRFSRTPVLAGATFPSFCRSGGFELVYMERGEYNRTLEAWEYTLKFLTDDNRPEAVETQKQTFTTDAVVKAEGKTIIFTTDAVVAERKTITFTTDGHVVARVMGTFTTDCVVEQHKVEFTTDAVVKVEDTSMTFTTDAVVAEVVVHTIGTDGAPTRDYADLITWDAAEQRDLVAANEIEYAECYNDGPISGPSIIEGWTTGEGHYIKLYTPTAERHRGYAGTGLVLSDAAGNDTLTLREPNVWVEGFEIEAVVDKAGIVPHIYEDLEGWFRIDKNIFLGPGNGVRGLSTLPPATADSDVFIWNNLFFAPSYFGISILNDHIWHIYANSFAQANGISMTATSQAVTVKNCAVLYPNATGQNYNETSYFAAGSTNNASTLSNASDYKAPGSNAVYDALSTDNYYTAEVLRIRGTGELYQAGADLSSDSTLSFTDDINGVERGATWDIGAFKQADPTEHISTVGSDVSRDYALLSDWEAQETNLPGENLYETVLCYNDSAMTDNVVIDWVTMDICFIKISTPVSERHTGLKGTGFRLTGAAGSNTITLNTPYVWIEGLSISNADVTKLALAVDITTVLGWVKFSHNLVYNCYGTSYADLISGSTAYIWNNFFVACGYGVLVAESTLNAYVYSNSIYGNTIRGLQVPATNQLVRAKNNTVLGTTGNFDYLRVGYFHADSDYNVSTADAASDFRAPGANSLHAKLATDNYTNISAGNEDLHVKSVSSDIYETGVDLATDPDLDFTDDIDGDARLRPDWEIGADYFTTTHPTITDIDPNTGPYTGGTSVTITGTNFGSGAGTVTFDAVEATAYASWSTTEIVCTTPAHAVGAVDVVVTEAVHLTYATEVAGFTYYAPTITLINPNSGTVDGGTAVTITGTHFEATEGFLYFDAISTEVTSWSDTSITCLTPVHLTPGAVDVKVGTIYATEVTAVDGYTYLCNVPTITLIDPDSGTVSGGTYVEITGTNFGELANSVFFDTAEIDLLIWEDDSIVIITPAHAAGFVDVMVRNICLAEVTAVDGYEYVVKNIIIGGVHIKMMMMRRSG